MEQYKNNETEQLIPERGVIAELVDNARAEGYTMAEVGVWGSEGVIIPEGEVGMIPTEALNGCHVTVVAAELPGGEKSINMTHFPPGIGAQRYIESLKEIQNEIAIQGGTTTAIVSLVASDRLPHETAALQDIFPDTPPHTLSYVSRSKERRSRPDAGQCVAVLDRRNQTGNTLLVATDSGDIVLDA